MPPAGPLKCPRCLGFELTAARINRCARCSGTWVSEAALHERVTEMQRAPANLSWHHDPRAPLPCVVCAAPMETLSLFEVSVDRCRAHGVWFDADELATVLLRSHQPTAPGHDWCDYAEGAVDVAFVVPAALDASGGVLEAGVEVLGAIFSAIDL